MCPAVAMNDPSFGWEGAAGRFAALRSDIGRNVVLHWATHIPTGGATLDVGCGTGLPVARALSDAGFSVHGVDPSPTLLAAFRRNVPGAFAAEEPAETSRFFDRKFEGIAAIGLLFLLPEDRQGEVLLRIAKAMKAGGHLLFSAPEIPCHWDDSLTGRRSCSLGKAEYSRILTNAGCSVLGSYRDEGGNHYCHATRSEDQPFSGE